jgi:VCBS repeat protein/FG-GAP repeat protein
VISQFFAYDKSFAGGVRLAVGDLTGDGVPDIATGPGPGINSQVRIFKTNLSADQTTVTNSLLTSFNAFPKYNGGVHIAVGDVTGDGRADIVVGTDSGKTTVRVYNGATISASSPPALLTEMAPYGSQTGGARVALVDLDGDGVNELITSSSLTGSKVKPKAFDLLPDGHGGLTATSIDAYFASFTSDPFFQGALFLGGGN